MQLRRDTCDKTFVARFSRIRVKSIDEDLGDDTGTANDYQNKIKGLEEEIKKLKENDKTTDDSTINEKGILKNATICGVKSEPENIKYELTDWKKNKSFEVQLYRLRGRFVFGDYSLEFDIKNESLKLMDSVQTDQYGDYLIKSCCALAEVQRIVYHYVIEIEDNNELDDDALHVKCNMNYLCIETKNRKTGKKEMLLIKPRLEKQFQCWIDNLKKYGKGKVDIDHVATEDHAREFVEKQKRHYSSKNNTTLRNYEKKIY